MVLINFLYVQVYNYIAQKDARINQKLSEYSTELAADSREIAAAAKRDSSAMKGIAFLTMVFLPGTYTAVRFTYLLKMKIGPHDADFFRNASF